MGGWVDGWMGGWVDGWMGGSVERSIGAGLIEQRSAIGIVLVNLLLSYSSRHPRSPFPIPKSFSIPKFPSPIPVPISNSQISITHSQSFTSITDLILPIRCSPLPILYRQFPTHPLYPSTVQTFHGTPLPIHPSTVQTFHGTSLPLYPSTPLPLYPSTPLPLHRTNVPRNASTHPPIHPSTHPPIHPSPNHHAASPLLFTSDRPMAG
jgi:hypothetical protein